MADTAANDPFGGLGDIEMKNANISLGDHDGGMGTGVVKLDGDSERAGGLAPQPSAYDLSNLNTLDEPISDTIKRDLTLIYSKLRIVINPMQLGI
jgi:hypothetical protein